ncbi:MAG: hypothetical protein ACHQCF_02005 [Solirubrobacterales bacterium]
MAEHLESEVAIAIRLERRATMAIALAIGLHNQPAAAPGKFDEQ